MKHSRWPLAALAMIALLALAACQETTPVSGPPGERGPAGPPGAVELTVRVFTADASSFRINGDIATALWPMPEITQAVFDGGLVSAHWRYRRTHTGWRSLPDVFQWPDLVTADMEFVYTPGYVGVQVTSPDAVATAAYAATSEGFQLRVAVIAPTNPD